MSFDSNNTMYSKNNKKFGLYTQKNLIGSNKKLYCDCDRSGSGSGADPELDSMSHIINLHGGSGKPTVSSSTQILSVNPTESTNQINKDNLAEHLYPETGTESPFSDINDTEVESDNTLESNPVAQALIQSQTPNKISNQSGGGKSNILFIVGKTINEIVYMRNKLDYMNIK